MKLKILGLIIVVLAMTACNSCTDAGTSASMLQVVSLTGNDLEGEAGSTTVFSDVITEGSIINDNGVAAIQALPLDPMTDADQLTPYMDVTVDQIDVEFRRTDGRNVEGVDVPYRFTQPMNMVVPIADTVEIPFVLIRHMAKEQSPLLRLRDNLEVLHLVAVVTIHGKDLGGHRVTPVTGYVSVWCANFADPETTTGGSH